MSKLYSNIKKKPSNGTQETCFFHFEPNQNGSNSFWTLGLWGFVGSLISSRPGKQSRAKCSTVLSWRVPRSCSSSRSDKKPSREEAWWRLVMGFFRKKSSGTWRCTCVYSHIWLFLLDVYIHIYVYIYMYIRWQGSLKKQSAKRKPDNHGEIAEMHWNVSGENGIRQNLGSPTSTARTSSGHVKLFPLPAKLADLISSRALRLNRLGRLDRSAICTIPSTPRVELQNDSCCHPQILY